MTVPTLTSPLLSGDARGGINRSLVYYNRNGVKCVRSFVKPVGEPTDAQRAQRAGFQALQQTGAQFNDTTMAANAFRARRRRISPLNLFNQINRGRPVVDLAAETVDLSAIDFIVPSLNGVAPLALLSVITVNDAMFAGVGFSLSSVPLSPGAIDLIAVATDAQIAIGARPRLWQGILPVTPVPDNYIVPMSGSPLPADGDMLRVGVWVRFSFGAGGGAVRYGAAAAGTLTVA